MTDLPFWPRFVLAVLATWRIAHLVAREDGPARVFGRVRDRFNGELGRLVDCFHCVSVWVAALLALFVATRPLDWLVAWLAIAGAASLIDRAAGEPVVIFSRATAEQEGKVSGDELLRSAAQPVEPEREPGESGRERLEPGREPAAARQ